ncbi:MAG: ADP-ribosylation factor-like protein [Promethearchaeota archaeon]|jgi:GTPase SAR1 family protein
MPSNSTAAEIIKVFTKFLDPNAAKLNKLHTIEDILKLSINTFKFIDKEEFSMIKKLLDISTIRDASTLNKENPFEDLIKIEESDESIVLKENLKEKIEELKIKYPTLEGKLKKTVTISFLISSVEEEKDVLEVTGQKVLVAGLDEAGKTATLSKFGGRLGISETIATHPTKGVVRMKFGTTNLTLFLWDLGGQEEYRESYLRNPEKYFVQLDLLIYVVDVQDPDRFDESLNYFSRILDSIILLEENPYVLIFIHKFDPDLKNDPKILLNVELLKDNLRDLLKTKEFEFQVEIYLTSIYSLISREPQFAKYIKNMMSTHYSLTDPTVRKVEGLGKTLEETLNAVIRLSESISTQLNDLDSRLRAIEAGAFQAAQSGLPLEISNPSTSSTRVQENARLQVLNELKDLFGKRRSLDL